MVLILNFELCPWSFAAAPTLAHLFPVAVQAGTTNTITAAGKFDPWPPKVWVDSPEILFKPETNRGIFTLEVATNATVGPNLVRMFNGQGASGPRFLIVTSEPQFAEQEPNDEFSKPQVLESLPASINGRLEKSGDVDSFAVRLEAGQTLVASLEAYTLASPVDAVFRLVDSRGVQVAFNHDDGRTFDPFLAWTASSAGTCILQVFGFAYPATSDVKFTGGNACVYRLHISRGPYLHYTLPLGVQRGARTMLELFGWNLNSGIERRSEFDGSQLGVDVKMAAFKSPNFENNWVLPIGDGPEIIEREPNNSIEEANHLDIPSAVTGCIEQPGDEDRFAFEAKKGDKLLLEIQSASLGFPLDARLKIEDVKGNELVKSDDGATRDPVIEWTAPEEGKFVAAIGNVLHRGGPNHLYRLSVSRASPALKATVAENGFTIEPGKTNEIKVAVKRLHGFPAKLMVSAKGLPEDVKADSVEVPAKGGDVSLKLVATPEAKSFSGAIEVLLTETESGQEHRAMHEIVTSGSNNGVPNGFSKLVVETTNQLWLTVLPRPDPKLETGK